MPKGRKQPPTPWSIFYFKRHHEDDPRRPAPGRDYVEACPTGVKADIFATLKAVAEAPPPQFSGGGRWIAMHGSMKGYYEVRIMGPGRSLYRVFCLLERDTQELGFGNNGVVVIQGMTKAHGTAFTATEYASVRELGDEYRARKPRSVI
ncbi:MAG: hypothetical protein M3Q23_01310 [Actinomycetota bacterium]|nr:hypothetical protein [Actinomycetota bacterium]